ncbi:peroxidase 57-like isoform X2 [Miscanthus floridulus]|uniref:peroxidase 57-like isoform X2 n=1 Tax=Miscanthus floridulus TaxID=154761 RepID=UPI00345A484E
MGMSLHLLSDSFSLHTHLSNLYLDNASPSSLQEQRREAMSLGPVARGAICLLAASIIVISTVNLRCDGSRSADDLSLDDYGEDDNGDSSSSFTFRPETSSPGLVFFGFYDDKYPDAEEIISSTVRKLYHADPNVAAALVRLFFHDCFIHVRRNKQTPCRPASHLIFPATLTRAHTKTLSSPVRAYVQGCDASVLLDRVDGRKSERDAGPNQSVRGMGAVEAIKQRVEKACPGTVSCADILALAARDSLVLVGGPTYPVLTGRRHSAQSFYHDVVAGSIPPPNATYAMTLAAFARRGQFTEPETVALLGAHSIGKVRCMFFADRIYDFAGTGAPNDSIDPDMVGEKRAVCGGGGGDGDGNDGAAAMEMGYYRQGREVGFGAHYYAKLLEGGGILRADQQLTAGSTVRWVCVYASRAHSEEVFREDFAHAMVKLSALAPLTGSAGQVRISCSKPIQDN